MTSDWLTISGGSGSSGLYAYRSEDGTFAVSVLVYPKAWPRGIGGAEAVYRNQREEGREVFTVLLREGSSLYFEVEPSSEPAINEMIGELQTRRSAWRAARRAEQGWAASGEAESDEGESDVELAHASATSLPVECALTFSLLPARNAKAARPPIDDPAEAASVLTEALRDLAWLCLRADELRSAAADGLGEESAGHLLDAARAADQVDPLALLAELDFVNEMHRLQHRIRKGYVPEEDRLAAIRGRITDRGVLDYEMTGIPLLECRFDEFVEATPLFRTLVTALDVVSAGSLRSTLGVETDGVFGSMSEVHPRTMREQLRSIPSLPLPVARATADRLRLTRLQQEWQRPLDLAKRILRAESVETGEATQEGSMTVWTVDTPKVWESILEQAFRKVDGVTVDTQQGMQPPWQGLGAERRPDLTVTRENKTYLLDAKYKLGTPGSNTADQYQLFAYSLVNAQQPAGLALVYPLPEGAALARQHGSSFERASTNVEVAGMRAAQPKLLLLQAPFPAPRQAQDEGKWQHYLISVGTTLSNALVHASTQPRLG